jgi:4-hydroxy-tetrahydrodipicolinate reductase
MKLKIAQFGLGPIGLATVKLLATKPWAQVVGGIDIAPSLVGKSLGELTGVARLARVRAYPDLASLLRNAKPDLIIHTSVSRLADAIAQIEPIVSQGIDVVSSCEELVFPQLREPKLAAKLNRLCIAKKARVVGTGVNPGFVMDVLPLCITGVSSQVKSLEVERIVDASTRREPLQRKIGSGTDPREFQKRLDEGKAGHAGLKESLALLAHSLGWKLAGIHETAKPVLATRNIRTKYFDVRKGQTCGIHQTAEAHLEDGRRIALDIQMYLGAKNPHDLVTIAGEPPLRVRVEGGVAGDQATVAALVNTAYRLPKATPGLLLMTDLTLPRIAPNL